MATARAHAALVCSSQLIKGELCSSWLIRPPTTALVCSSQLIKGLCRQIEDLGEKVRQRLERVRVLKIYLQNSWLKRGMCLQVQDLLGDGVATALVCSSWLIRGLYRGTSLKRNTPLLGTYRSPNTKDLW